MLFDDPKFQEFAQAQAAAALAEMGYEPVRDLPWGDIPPPEAPFEDLELEPDIDKLRFSQADLIARLRGLPTDTDSFSLPTSGDSTSLSFNEVIVAAQRFLLWGVDQIAVAAERYRQVANEAPPRGTRLTSDDQAYVREEIQRRKNLAEQLLEYWRDPDNSASPPRKPSGEVISPILASGLAERYAADAFILDKKLDAELTLSLVDQVGDHVNQILGIVGASGSEFIRTLAADLEKARRRGVRRRGAAVTTVSLALAVGGVFISEFISQAFGDLLALFMAAAAAIWLYDRVFSVIVERQTRRWRLQVIMDAIDWAAEQLVFLRQQQFQLNIVRSSVGKPVAKLIDVTGWSNLQ